MPVVLQYNSHIDWLKDVPEELWAKSKTNIGHMKEAVPVVVRAVNARLMPYQQ